MDLSRLFEKARRWHEEGTYSYGRVLLLQCLWHNLTSPKQEDMQVDVTSSGAPTPSASSSATFKGVTYSPGDWVHLANKEIPSKPIVAQVQKIEGADSAKTLSLTWYWRPEQTVHSATRSFWEREVFKTAYTTSNSLQEIIEPITCQFFPKHPVRRLIQELFKDQKLVDVHTRRDPQTRRRLGVHAYQEIFEQQTGGTEETSKSVFKGCGAVEEAGWRTG
ncbi:hypothetical protein FS749_010266 [Ceratobasidium sp. UAMH 11750]|nr:hypothetical protein FS749_010266 [Ceratobasidium sp. UAMH 11750]